MVPESGQRQSTAEVLHPPRPTVVLGEMLDLV